MKLVRLKNKKFVIIQIDNKVVTMAENNNPAIEHTYIDDPSIIRKCHYKYAKGEKINNEDIAKTYYNGGRRWRALWYVINDAIKDSIC